MNYSLKKSQKSVETTPIGDQLALEMGMLSLPELLAYLKERV